MDIDAASPDNQNRCLHGRNIINDASDFEDEFVPRERQGGLAGANNNHSSEEVYSSSDDDTENRGSSTSKTGGSVLEKRGVLNLLRLRQIDFAICS